VKRAPASPLALRHKRRANGGTQTVLASGHGTLERFKFDAPRVAFLVHVEDTE